MELSQHSIKALVKIVIGDREHWPYRTGSELVNLFNEYGAKDTYEASFPARWLYAQESLRALNGTNNLAAVICHVFDPREFMDTEQDYKPAIEFINKWFEYDGYQVAIEHGKAKIRNVNGSDVRFSSPHSSGANSAYEFINEQIDKSEQKILASDYDGAITNARSLIEGVMRDIELALNSDAPKKYDGNIVRLYKRVQKILNLEPSRPDIDDPLKQVLLGLINIISGLATVRNRMSDAHVRSYKPSKHHAVLVVNSAKTLANFLYDTKEYQSLKAK